MPITDDRIARLREFGLSEYAARVYLALLDLGVTEARDASSLSKVPTSKIYHVLEQLHQKGLVSIIPEFPKKYGPVPFDEFLEKLREEHEEACRSIDRDSEDLKRMFSVRGNVEASDRGGFTVIRGRRNVLEKMLEMQENTERDLLLVGSRGFHARARHYLSSFQRLREAGVETRILAPVTRENLDSLSLLTDVAEVRARDFDELTDSGNVTIVIADSARALLIHFVPDDGHAYEGNDTGILTDQEAMVSVLRSLLETHWRRAATFATRAKELKGTRMPEFTRFLGEESEFHASLAEALQRGSAEIVSANTVPGMPPSARAYELARIVGGLGGRIRLLMDLGTTEALDAAERLIVEAPGSEVRHFQADTPSVFVVLEEREAFFTLAKPAPRMESKMNPLASMAHTSHGATVDSLRDLFEEMWSKSVSLEARRKSLENTLADAPSRQVPVRETSASGAAPAPAGPPAQGAAGAHTGTSEPPNRGGAAHRPAPAAAAKETGTLPADPARPRNEGPFESRRAGLDPNAEVGGAIGAKGGKTPDRPRRL